jgi:hypothetical protein
MKNVIFLVLVFAAFLFISACGGGSGISTPTLGGVAAVGYPIANGAVMVKFAAGNSLSTTTGSDGKWLVAVSGQTLPCAVEVSGGTINGVANTVRYHSVATSLGTVNVTPLTDLMVANLAAQDPDTWFAGVTGTILASSVTTTSVNSALTNLRAAFSSLTPLSTINPVTTTFTAGSGNTTDDMLLALKTATTTTNSSYTTLRGSASTTSFATAAASINTALPAAYANTTSGSTGGGTKFYRRMDVQTTALSLNGSKSFWCSWDKCPGPTCGYIVTGSDLRAQNMTLLWNIPGGDATGDIFGVVATTKGFQLTFQGHDNGTYELVSSWAEATQGDGGICIPQGGSAGNAPTITGMTPSSGAVGTTVTITGTNFSSTPSNNLVKFGAGRATVTAATSTSITTTVPSDAVTGKVSVTTMSGPAASAGNFTVGASTNRTFNSILQLGGNGQASYASSFCSSPLSPKSATLRLTSSDLSNLTGTGTVTLNNNSSASLTLTSSQGSFTTSGTTLYYTISPFYNPRILNMYIGTNSAPTNNCLEVLRDNAQPNTPPTAFATRTFSAVTGYPYNCYFKSDPTQLVAGVAAGDGNSSDSDGFIVSQQWSSSKGKTGTSSDFFEVCSSSQDNGTVTLKVTDDEGATGTKTWTCCDTSRPSPPATSGSLTLTAPFTSLTGLVYNASSDQTITRAGGSKTQYIRLWTNNASFWSASLGYVVGDSYDATQESLLFLGQYSNTAQNFAVGGPVVDSYTGQTSYDGTCSIRGSNHYNDPLCSSWGITVSRSAGTISFSNTPVFDMLSAGNSTAVATGRMSGTLSFTPF